MKTLLTPKQVEALRGFLDWPGECGKPEPTQFTDGGNLWHVNRERLMKGLMRRGLLSTDMVVTAEGRQALYEANPKLCPQDCHCGDPCTMLPGHERHRCSHHAGDA